MSTHSIPFALNQRTVPQLDFEAFLDLAVRLECVGVEPRTDMGRPIFDGASAASAATMAKTRGLRFIGLSEVYPFDDWTLERRDAVRHLLDLAHESGAESISLIPRVDGHGPAGDERLKRHIDILAEIDGFRGDGVRVLVEPIGFPNCSIRHHADAAAAIDAQVQPSHFGLVHDTFQHALAGDTGYALAHIGVVHISGCPIAPPALNERHDGQRVLVDAMDEAGAIEQIRHLLNAGYSGAFSHEVTAPLFAGGQDPEGPLRSSMNYIKEMCG